MKSPVLRDSETHRRVTISSGVQEVQSSYRVTPRAVSESAQRPSMYTSPEPVYKQRTQGPSESICMPPGPSPNPSAHAKVELTPRPLPPRSLPRYGPDCSWWTLLNRDVEMPQSRPTTPDFEPKYPSPVDYSLSFFEMDSSPFCEDLVFQREKASPSPPPARATPPPHLQLPKEPPSWTPLREVPQTPKHTSKQPTQRFSAFFLGM